jgi:hypothetical protein
LYNWLPPEAEYKGRSEWKPELVHIPALGDEVSTSCNLVKSKSQKPNNHVTRNVLPEFSYLSPSSKSGGTQISTPSSLMGPHKLKMMLFNLSCTVK